MTSMTTRMALFAGIAMFGLTGPAASLGLSGNADATPAKAVNVQYAAVICMTEDSGGRKRPCSADYKAANPGWRGSDSCMTEDSGGRKRPCSADYKAKHKK
jgi:hypothetical protein